MVAAGSATFVVEGDDGLSGLSVDVWSAMASEIGAGTRIEAVAEAACRPQNYGFAVSPDSGLARDLDLAVLRLQEAGELSQIEERWLGAGP